MNAKEFEIEFYDRMSRWVQGGKTGPDPRGEWEFRIGGKWSASTGVHIDPTFSEVTQYRWKPAKKRTVIIGGIELVAPEVDALHVGAKFYSEGLTGKVDDWKWGNHPCDYQALKNGKVFLTHEDCQAMADAQRKQRMGGAL